MLAQAAQALPRMIDAVRALVEVESPTADPRACGRCLDAAADVIATATGRAPAIEVHRDWPVLRWGPSEPSVLLLGHLDTVWPIGTLERLPWTCDGQRMTGPGVFDMKAGAVQAICALQLAGIGPADGVGILLTTDEEEGSFASEDLIRGVASTAGAVLVLEPGIGQAVKIGRKGTSMYDLEVRGRAAHAGLDPERGVNALVEAATLVHDLVSYADPHLGTTVTPTLARAGVTSNTVPDVAVVTVDVRAWSATEQRRVDDAVRGWGPTHPDAGFRVASGGIRRPALEEAAAAELFSRCVAIAARLGLPPLEGRTVGGASDGNFTAALGVPTLDGLGAVGDGAHADHEWASVPDLADRAALLAELLPDLLERPPARLGASA